MGTGGCTPVLACQHLLTAVSHWPEPTRKVVSSKKTAAERLQDEIARTLGARQQLEQMQKLPHPSTE